MQNKTARNYWKNFSQNYSFPDPFDNSNKARKVEWEAINKAFNINKSTHSMIIELGCGTGHFTLNFLKKGFSVTGIDAINDLLRIVNKRAKTFGLSKNLSLINSDLSKALKSKEKKYDAGFIISTYHCISNNKKEQENVLRNFIRLLRPGGKLLIMEPNPLNPLYFIFYPFVYGSNWREGFNIINSRKGLLKKSLLSMGMEKIEIYYHSFLPTSLINKSEFIKEVNKFLCSLPLIRNFAAFNIIVAIKE